MTLDTIDLDAFYYQEHSKPQFDRAQELLKSLCLGEVASILDIGCGYGNIIAELSQKALKGRSIGIDASPNMIHLAREQFPQFRFPNLEFQVAKAEEINFPENYFDVIVCFSCLLWVRKPRQALDLMCKFLKPGGTLLILTYPKESAYTRFLENTLKKFPDYKQLSAAHSMLSVEECRDVLQSNGMQFEEFRLEDRASRYKNAQELKAYLKGWLTCYVPLPVDLQELFLDQAGEEAWAVSKSKAEIVLPYQLLVIRVRKPN